jgi:hypothetical protein
MDELSPSQKIMSKHLLTKKLMLRGRAGQSFHQKQNEKAKLVRKLWDSYSYCHKKKPNTFIYELLDSYRRK